MIFHSYVNVYQRVKYQPYGFHQDRWKSTRSWSLEPLLQTAPWIAWWQTVGEKMRCKDTSIGGIAFFGAGFFLKRYTGSVQFTPFFVVLLFCCPFILIGWEFGIPDFPMDCENPPYIGIVYSLRMLNAVQVEMWQIHRLGPLDLGFQAIKPLIERYVVSKGKGKKGLWRLKQP